MQDEPAIVLKASLNLPPIINLHNELSDFFRSQSASEFEMVFGFPSHLEAPIL